jgi:hypothetical protein
MSTAADAIRPAPVVTDRELQVLVPVELADALDRHLVNRLELDATAENRDEVICAALRAHLDFWPEQAPAGAYRVDGQGRARMRRPWRRDARPTEQAAGRTGPAASATDPAERALELARQAAKPAEINEEE